MKITKQLLIEMIEEEIKVIELGLGPPLQAHGYIGGEKGMEIQPSEPQMVTKEAWQKTTCTT